MAAEWRTAKVEELAEKVGMGPFGSSIKVETFADDGIPVISGQHLHETRLEDGEYNFITVEHAQKLKNANVYRGDVIFTHAGNIGQTAYIPETSKYDRYVISQRQFYLRCDRSKILPGFVARYFKTPEGRHKLLANASSVGVPSIAQPVSYLRSIEVPVPPLAEQRAITNIFDALDDKIELNRRMNETLEALALALFKSRFIDATQDGLPKGWHEGALGEITGFLGGYAFKSKDWINQGVPVVKIGSVRPGIVDLNEVSFVSDAVAEEAKRFRLSPGDLLIGMTGYVGEVGLVPLTENTPLLNQRVGKFLLKEPGTSALGFLYCLTRRREFKAEVEAKSHGTAQANVSADGILSVPIVIPPEALQSEFNRVCEPILNRILLNHAESNTLGVLRDMLLPRLFSGELRAAIPNRGT